MIETQALTKLYERPSGWRRLAKEKTVTAVADITLSISPGELFGLLGPNGAGKTTLVKMLCTLILPSSGAALVARHSLAQADKIRAAVGLVVSDERSFYWRLSARHNLEFFAAMYGLYGRSASDRINTVLEQVNLLEVAERPFSNFSSGMRQRLAIARSLLHQPQLLFLDEPTRSLDPNATQSLHNLIRQFIGEQGMTVFLVTHDLAEAEKLCDRVALMHNGRIRTTGRPAELRQQLHQQRHYSLQVGAIDETVLKGLAVAYENGRITFRASEEDGVLTAVLNHLHQQRIPIQAIEANPPSLEEVFNHMTKDEG